MVYNSLDSLEEALLNFLDESTELAKDFVALEILRKTSKGLDADGKSFPPFKKSTIARYKKLGLNTGQKRLLQTGGLYQAIQDSTKVSGNRMVIPEAYQKIAHGQMYHKKWDQHNMFFLAGNGTNAELAKELAGYITKL